MKTVLIADDATFMRLKIRKMLEKNGFKIVGEAEDGEVAVNKYKKLKPNIITLDITMPGMNGIEALKLIKEFDKDAKVLIISALGLETVVVEAVVLGASGFIIKPFNEKTLVEAIRNLL